MKLEQNPLTEVGQAQIRVMAAICRGAVNSYTQCGRDFSSEYRDYEANGSLPVEGIEADYAAAENALTEILKLHPRILHIAFSLDGNELA